MISTASAETTSTRPTSCSESNPERTRRPLPALSAQRGQGAGQSAPCLWLFADTVAGANASARLYSLIECAKANGLEPYAYLRHVFTELPKAKSLAEVEALLPTRLDPAALT